MAPTSKIMVIGRSPFKCPSGFLTKKKPTNTVTMQEMQMSLRMLPFCKNCAYLTEEHVIHQPQLNLNQLESIVSSIIFINSRIFFCQFTTRKLGYNNDFAMAFFQKTLFQKFSKILYKQLILKNACYLYQHIFPFKAHAFFIFLSQS
ncbi:hypothetical protein CsSME_00012140 [Camellia sinensis var. sinensis]